MLPCAHTKVLKATASAKELDTHWQLAHYVQSRALAYDSGGEPDTILEEIMGTRR